MKKDVNEAVSISTDDKWISEKESLQLNKTLGEEHMGIEEVCGLFGLFYF